MVINNLEEYNLIQRSNNTINKYFFFIIISLCLNCKNLVGTNKIKIKVIMVGVMLCYCL